MFPLALLRLQSILSHPTPGFSGDSVDLSGQINNQSEAQPQIDAGGMPIGNQPQQQTPPQSGESNNVVSPYDVGNLYQPHTAITAQYSNALQNAPQRDEHPGFGRGLLGVIAGLGAGVHPAGIAGGQPIGFEGNPALAAQTADQITQRPYYTKLGDYEQKLKNLQQGATEEDRYNTNARQLAIGEVARRTAEKRADTYAAQETERERANKEKEANAKTRTAAYVYHQTHPKSTFQEDAAGNVVAIDENNNVEHLYDPESGEYLKGSKLPEEQKMIMGFKNAKALVGVRESAAEKLENVREGNREKDIQSRGEQQRTTNAAKPNAANANNETPAQAKTRIYNKLHEAYNSHPEWQKYIDPQAGTIKPAPDETTNQSIHDFIYSKDIALPKDKISSNVTTPAEEKELTVTAKDLRDNTTHTFKMRQSQIDKIDPKKFQILSKQ